MDSVSCPVIIGARLMPAVRVGAATVSVDPTSRRDRRGKPEWNWYVDAPGLEESGAELWGWDDAAGMLETLLSFLAACGDGVNYATRTGRQSENAELFPPAVAEWCAANSDELSLAAFELEEWRAANRG